MNDLFIKYRLRAVLTVAAWITAAVALPVFADPLDVLLAEQASANKAAAANQVRVGKLDDESADLLDKYRRLLKDIDSFKSYNEQVSEQIKSQDAELSEVNKLLAEIEVTAREVLPLMKRMVEVFDDFVKVDLPFLLEERTKRVASLKDLLPRADISFSEKYRRILEAYQIEMEYGRTIDAYEGNIQENGKDRTVEFVRLGRISLMYRTLDGKESGYWDADKKSWIRDDSYASAIRHALRVAKKQGAPDLLFAPVPAPRKITP